MTIDQQFQDLQPVIADASRYVSIRLGQPFRDVLEDAQVTLFLLLKEGSGYNAERGSFEAWIKCKIIWRLKTLYLRGKIPFHRDLSLPISSTREKVLSQCPDDNCAPEAEVKENWFKRILLEVSEECAALLQIIREAPDDLWLEICPCQGRSAETKQQNLRQWLIDVADWHPEKIDTAFSEIQACL